MFKGRINAAAAALVVVACAETAMEPAAQDLDLPIYAAKQTKVDVCHTLGNGVWNLINVSEKAVPAHLNHGDGVPGGDVPGMAGLEFDTACVPLEKTGGELVVAPIGANARAEPDFRSQLLATVPPGARGTVTGDRVEGPGDLSGLEPWTPVDLSLLMSEGGQLPPFVATTRVVALVQRDVLEDVGGEKIAEAWVGSRGTVLAGPETHGSETLYQVDWDLGSDGWVGEDLGFDGWVPDRLLESASQLPLPEQPAVSFSVGDRIVLQLAANVRSSWGSTAPFLDTQPAGSMGTVTGGPVGPLNSFIWWRIGFDAGVDGWVQENTFEALTLPSCARAEEVSITPAYDPYTALMEQVVAAGPLYTTSSSTVDGCALLDAGWMLQTMLQHRPDVASVLRGVGTITGVFGRDQDVCDLLYFADLRGTNPLVCDEAVGGLGGVPGRHATACAELNLLSDSSDPLKRGQPDGENACVHELAHTIMNIGLSETQRAAIRDRFAAVVTEGELWTEDAFGNDTFALTNADEFWAEISQAYFCANPATLAFLHNGVNCADQLEEYDPVSFMLVHDAYGGSADLR